MKIASGTVVDGKIVLQGEALSEGALVTVLAREGDETFTVSADEERELLAAISEAERGEAIAWEEFGL
ncbi:MAG: hypothetical protein JJT93_15765 [Gammaproteobacteria bacterium]|nr:hypothetical protein [Gammaproteobacteria bacterium]